MSVLDDAVILDEIMVTYMYGCENQQALQRAARFMRDHTWKPIDTAPKDGTHILAYDGIAITTVRWKEIFECWALVETGIDATDDEWEPTHWMPLHSPPGATTCEER